MKANYLAGCGKKCGVKTIDPLTIISAIGAVRAGLEGAENLKSISGSINALLDSKDEHERREKEKPKTYNQSVLAERVGDSGEDETDLSVIMDGVIEEQNHKIQLENLKREINYKWPTPQGQPSTWDLILKARKKAIETKKVRIEKQKEQAIKKKREDKIFWDKVLTAIWQTAIVLLIFGGIVWFISKNCKGC